MDEIEDEKFIIKEDIHKLVKAFSATIIGVDATTVVRKFMPGQPKAYFGRVTPGYCAIALCESLIAD
ncbi:MAG: hypothetical protein IPP46_06070 [Bacteroidetes bacterium]|nr:hypothetical protein [Bacteroidota bacterium]